MAEFGQLPLQLRRSATSSSIRPGAFLASPKLVEALDISREDPKIVERYGQGVAKYIDDGAPRVTENLLVARRLVEAGARVVSLNFSRWDWHGGNFAQGRTEFPLLDNAVSALVQDLHDRGLDKDVSVVVWGEFGRTPTINNDAGRDHWPRVNSALLACGGMKTGQVIGATDKQAGEVSIARSLLATFTPRCCTTWGSIRTGRFPTPKAACSVPWPPKPARLPSWLAEILGALPRLRRVENNFGETARHYVRFLAKIRVQPAMLGTVPPANKIRMHEQTHRLS